MARAADVRALRLATLSTWLLIAGILISGPLAMLIVGLVAPQSAWVDATTFVANYHPIQAFPYFFGFLLMLGSVLLVSAIYRLAKEEDRSIMLPALVFVSIYASIVSLNYVLQTTFVPSLARHFAAENSVLISALSMSNPDSLAWALEMWAYAFQGLAFAFIMPYFKSHLLRWLLVLNLAISIIGAAMVAVDIAWVFSTAGMIGFFAWNVLMVVLLVLMLLEFRRC